MAGTHTPWGAPCPWPDHEGDGLTMYVALVPLGEKPAHRYAVCKACYLHQFRIAYPGVEAPDLSADKEPEPEG